MCACAYFRRNHISTTPRCCSNETLFRHKILWRLEGTRQGFGSFQPLGNLAGVLVALLPSELQSAHLTPNMPAFLWDIAVCFLSDICFKQHFYTRYLVFYDTSPPRMFLSLDLLWEYRIQHGANGPLYVTSSYSTWIFCRGVSGFATDCPCCVWCRGLTTCLLHVRPLFGNRILNNSWAVGLT